MTQIMSQLIKLKLKTPNVKTAKLILIKTCLCMYVPPLENVLCKSVHPFKSHGGTNIQTHTPHTHT